MPRRSGNLRCVSALAEIRSGERGLALVDPVRDRESQQVTVDPPTVGQRGVGGLQPGYLVLEIPDAVTQAPQLGHHAQIEIMPNMTE
jgi:hypothetical protein